MISHFIYIYIYFKATIQHLHLRDSPIYIYIYIYIVKKEPALQPTKSSSADNSWARQRKVKVLYNLALVSLLVGDLNSEIRSVALPRPVYPQKKRWNHISLKIIHLLENANSVIQDLNLVHSFHFL